jgi:hypothetical protein
MDPIDKFLLTMFLAGLLGCIMVGTVFVVSASIHTKKELAQPAICLTDDQYRESFIEAYNTGSSFAFYKDGIEYEFTPKYNK